MTMGQRIARMRKEQGFSQEALGEKLGVSRQSVYKWESDAAVPEIDKLITMSRLFGVTVGWLLGVEEAAMEEEPPYSSDDSEREWTAADDGELTDAQLKMVEEIVDRYIAAQPKTAKRRRWPWVVGVCAVIALVWALVDLSNELDVLNSRYSNLQNAVSNVSTTVNSQINGIADRVEEVLQSQNSLLADYLVEIAGADLMTNELLLNAKATPKTYVEGMAVAFVVDTGNGPTEYPAVEGAGHQFAADITCDLTDTTTVSVVFAAGDTRETQIIYTETYLYSGTFPSVSVEEHILMWKEMNKEGELVFRNEYAYIRDRDYAAAISGAIPVVEITELKVGFFKNRELVTWLMPYEGIPMNYQGFDEDTQFYRMPDMTIKAEESDIFCIATLVVDEYGRERLYPSIPYALNEDGELFWADDRIVEKDDWYNGTDWSN